MQGNSGRDHDDDWDPDFADELIGQTLLVGITYLDHEGELLRRQQVFGTVISANRGAGIIIRQHSDNESFEITPILSAIEYAAPGIYQLADSDAAVEDPDFTALFTVTTPNRH